MKPSEMLNQIKTLLNIEVILEEQKLENGTLVEAESFEKGKEIFIKTDDEKVAMPVGEYLLEDGRLVVVEEEGIIGDVRESRDDGKEAAVDDWQGMEKRIKNLEDAIADLKSKFSEKEEMGEENKPLKSRTVKEEFSEAAVKPIKHNPEGKEVKKRVFAKSKNRTTLDRVLNKLNK